MPSKTRQISKVKSTKSSSTKNAKTNNKYKSKGDYDTPRTLLFGGVIGLFLAYVIISRALNTGSYWEYFYGLAILVIAFRLFIRSLRVK